MEFRLTYEGPLMGAGNNNPRASHKHDIRRRFHAQLKRLWQVHPMLSHSKAFNWDQTKPPDQQESRVSELAREYTRNGYRFVPLVLPELRLLCGVEVLFLRPSAPGGVLRSADLDNRLKTLFDALRMPQSPQELAGNQVPGEGEDPFFVLTSDDSLITSVSVETDMLLEPLAGKATIDDHDARLFITVRATAYTGMIATLGF
jgi:hypothetical protein